MTEIQILETEIMKLSKRLAALRKNSMTTPVRNYQLQNFSGEVTLSDLFGEKNKLFVIHNMGQGCRYCTLWADGINGFLAHLENEFSVVLVSKDSPEIQRKFANSRGWRFRMASHGGGEYIKEQSVVAGENNMPGLVYYEKSEGQIFKKNSAVFGPGDLFCSMWHILALAGRDDDSWTPQYSYWQSPNKLDDGGKP